MGCEEGGERCECCPGDRWWLPEAERGDAAAESDHTPCAGSRRILADLGGPGREDLDGTIWEDLGGSGRI